MEATELRIGNLVLFDKEEVVRVEYISSHHVIGLFGKETEHILEKGDVSGIPITEEWLVRMGAKQDMGCTWLDITNDLDPMHVAFNKDGNVYLYKNTKLEDNLKKRIKHVHQLQNLYYALTGEELTIKP